MSWAAGTSIQVLARALWQEYVTDSDCCTRGWRFFLAFAYAMALTSVVFACLLLMTCSPQAGVKVAPEELKDPCQKDVASSFAAVVPTSRQGSGTAVALPPPSEAS